MSITSHYYASNPPKVGYADLDEEAGRRRGESWFNNIATLLHAERLLRVDDENDPFCDCDGLSDFITALVRFLLPTQAADPELVAKSWETLRGDAHAYSESEDFVKGFYVGARTAAWRRYDLRPYVSDWVKKLSPKQLFCLDNFACDHCEEVYYGNITYPECCRSAFDLCFYAAHGQLPLLNPRESGRYVRAWCIDSFEDDAPGCFIEVCVERFIQFVVQDMCDAEFTDEVEAASAALRKKRDP